MKRSRMITRKDVNEIKDHFFLFLGAEALLVESSKVYHKATRIHLN